MYGISEQLDLAPFIGKTLDSVSITPFLINFAFSGNPLVDKDCVITAEGHWELHDAQFEMVDKYTEHSKREFYKIHRILGLRVLAFKVNPPDSFTLIFENDWALSLFDSSSNYESLHIYDGDVEVHI
jgi:hypothetical protein